MKDVTFGVKVPKDQREEINKLMKDSGLVGREFMQQLVNAYMLKQHKNEIPEMAEDIKELEELTSRINQIYIYLGTRFQNTVKDYKKEIDNTNQKNDDNLESSNKQLEDYKESLKDVKIDMKELAKLNERLKQDKNNTTKELNELKEYNQNYKELNNEYKNKIENLTNEVKTLRSLKGKNQNLNKTNDDLASDLWFSKRKAEELNKFITETKEKFQESKKQIIDQYKLEKQTTVLELKLNHQSKIEELNNDIFTMQETHSNKVKDLILELEKIKNTGKDKKPKKD